jgi:Tol biopolymer transport system component
MSLTPGTRLGPYEITAPLGAGGMGEVYRARDTRLDREVAVKVLPRHLSTTPEVRARFEREAKTVSSLDHPHICTLFDIGREGDTDYLVMELIEGETLAERLAKGALPIAEVLALGGQIAEALERAHRAGVVHRDLKPGNVMLTKAGAKLMDFGLARATGTAGPGAESGAAPATATRTMAAPLTAEGTILGTFQYMAPEQLEGSEADARSDLWALGCVLYEMATGRRAFEGRSQASLITSIMGSQPASLSQVAPLSPPGLDRLVQACLAKDPADRLQSAHDIRMQLGWLADGGSQAGVPVPVAAKRRSRKRLVATLAAVGWLVAIAVAVTAWMAPRAPRPEPPFFTAVAPEDNPSGLANGGPIALSPDGTRLAMVVGRRGQTMISVYDFGSGSTSVLESTQGGWYPFWSPDSRWIGFFADGKLRKVEARGGPAQPLADAFTGRGGTWSPDGVIVFAPDIYGPLMKVSENGGPATALTEPGSEEITHRNPYFLSEGKRFLFTERGSLDVVGRLMVGSIDGATPSAVLAEASRAQLSDGYLLFVRNFSLLAQRFDEKTLALSGPILPIAEDVQYWNPQDSGNFSATSSGMLVFRRRADAERGLAWFDRDGRLIETLVPKEKEYRGAVPSRDLRQVGLVRRESSGQTLDIWLLDIESRQTRRATFTNTASQLLACAFSPGNRRMAVSNHDAALSTSATASGGSSSTLWIQPVSGSGSEEILLEKTPFYVTDWSPDGKVLLGWSQRTGTAMDVTVVRLDDPEPQVHDLIKTRFREMWAEFSPDGAWVAYQSDESGDDEVYVVDYPNATRKWQVSRSGGSFPVWSQDGGELFFRRSGDLMAATVTREGDGIEIGAPVKLGLSEAGVRLHGSDGERFLVTQSDPSAGRAPTQVIRNWSALLER